MSNGVQRSTMSSHAAPNATAGRAQAETLFQAAVARRDWKAACRHIPRLDAATTPPAVLDAAVNAAITAEDADAARAVAILAARMAIRPELRAGVAARLNDAGHPLLAIAVLLADPAVFRRDDVVSPEGMSLGRTLRSIARRVAPAEPALREGAQALARRLLNEEAAPPGPSSFAFAEGAVPLVLPPGRIHLHAAPGLAAGRTAEAEAALNHFEQQIERAAAPSVNLHRDVFVNRRGQIWREDGRAIRTFGTRIPPASLAAMEQAPRLPRAAMGIETHNNPYHWIGEVLPSLAWIFDDPAPAMPVLIRDTPAPFVRESLALASGAPLDILEVGDALHVGELHTGRQNLQQLSQHAGFYAATLARMTERAVAEAPDAGTGLLYVSRRDSGKRRLANEEVLEAALEARGFTVRLLSEMPYAAQFAAFTRARMIVAPHGAGLVHLIGSRPGTIVLEMVPAAPGSLTMRTCFARISRVFGLDHHLWLAPPAQPTLTSGWSIDLDAFLPAVDALLQPVQAPVAVQ